MKLCFSTLGCTERSLEKIIELCNQYSITNLEIRGIENQLNNSLIKDFADENVLTTKQLFKKNNITPLILGTSVSFHNAENYESAIIEGIKAIDIAQKLGCMGIRVFGNKLTEGSTERIISGIETLCTYAKENNIQILLEVHGDYNTYDNLSPILDNFKNNANFGLIWDIQHTSKTYKDRWEEFYSLTKPFIQHVHIKDSNDKGLTLIGEGNLPIVDIIKYLIDDGYDGVFSLEWEKKWHKELPEIETALESFIKLTGNIT